jgi:hypothetical protein
MDKPRVDQPAPHAEEKGETAARDGKGAPHAAPKDAEIPASKPQGTLEDQVQTMASEGQAQPQEGDLTPEELENRSPAGPPVRREPRRHPQSGGRSAEGPILTV